ncbi:ATP-binding protein [Novosphingobium sp. ZN18A2]|uniref:ATP-binding protein n=1 Tax=Novosphingobium sp. ZN18A2 TaxID=3079861 RepID=UPI0030CF011A
MANRPSYPAQGSSALSDHAVEPSGTANMRQLIALRWLAVIGQFVTIMIVHHGMDVQLPLYRMLAIVLGLVTLNLISMFSLRNGLEVGNSELFFELTIDVAALTGLLYLSGGATNPFIWLFLLQVALGAILLKPWSTWAIVLFTSACFVFLLVTHEPLVLPPEFTIGLFDLYIFGALTSFVIIAVLLVLFITRINANVRAGDARLAAMRQQAAEEDHIVRMGLLATGAAHELGTPLASLSVIANDWSHREDLLALRDLPEEVEDVRVAVERCKTIVGGILMSAGEARGEKTAVTTLVQFLQDIVGEWQDRVDPEMLRFSNRIDGDVRIVSDAALKQVIWNIFDNAYEASGAPATMTAQRMAGDLVLTVRDSGPGFAADILEDFGKPYRSTKQRRGGGLGLFLVVNVMRKLGGQATARNEPFGGATVELTLPIEAIEWHGDRQQ